MSMWTCEKCGEKLEDRSESCWRCSSRRPVPAATGTPVVEGATGQAPKWRMAYRYVRGTLATWDELFTQAAEIASEIGPERVLNISHSADKGNGVVTVWYWTTEDKVDQG